MLYDGIKFILKNVKGFLYSDVIYFDMKRFYDIIDDVQEEIKQKNETQKKIIEKRPDLFSYTIDL